jgi:seryl-tRNA(Sec) selenium transferase
LLEATQTTLFLAHMLRSNRLELVAVDPVVAEAIAAASATLIEAGQLDSSDAARIEGAIVSGADWPNTHDHMHTSWTR